MTIVCRGVRGATTVDSNTREEVLRRTREMLALMIRLNGIHPDEVAAALFTTTTDVNSEFPAFAARQLGWLNAALMCGHEMAVPGALGMCIRVLVFWNTDRAAADLHHVYVRGARHLRPDKAALPPVNWDSLNDWIERQMQSWRERRQAQNQALLPPRRARAGRNRYDLCQLRGFSAHENSRQPSIEPRSGPGHRGRARRRSRDGERLPRHFRASMVRIRSKPASSTSTSRC
ncbi:MAG: chorismate mutase [Anaerolineae bacterium]|nr:chorismate mutase [Anaerolineae bacterium]